MTIGPAIRRRAFFVDCSTDNGINPSTICSNTAEQQMFISMG
jgi:hypothetical protein